MALVQIVGRGEEGDKILSQILTRKSERLCYQGAELLQAAMRRHRANFAPLSTCSRWRGNMYQTNVEADLLGRTQGHIATYAANDLLDAYALQCVDDKGRHQVSLDGQLSARSDAR